MLEKDVLEALGERWIAEKKENLIKEMDYQMGLNNARELAPVTASVRRHVWNDVLLELFILANTPGEVYELNASSTIPEDKQMVAAYKTFASEQVGQQFRSLAHTIQGWQYTKPSA